MLQLQTFIHPKNGAKDGLLPDKHWDLAFTGSAYDDRGNDALNFVQARSSQRVKAYFDCSEGAIFLNDDRCPTSELIALIKPCAAILLDATTLGVADLLTLLRIIKKSCKGCFDILYIEPQEYANEEGFLSARRRRFSLSKNRRFQAIPGFVLELTSYKKPGTVIFFLGFEGERLQQALEQNPLEKWTKTAVFGLPAYRAGWELNAYANHAAQLPEVGFQSIEYCSANSVLLAYQLLCRHHESTPDPAISPTIVVPLGTKPHSIACALFLCSQSAFAETGVLYDYPEGLHGRSKEADQWHLYRITEFPVS